jgi:hypothetical protein
LHVEYDLFLRSLRMDIAPMPHHGTHLVVLHALRTVRERLYAHSTTLEVIIDIEDILHAVIDKLSPPAPRCHLVAGGRVVLYSSKR